jgi:hypothetical protein
MALDPLGACGGRKHRLHKTEKRGYPRVSTPTRARSVQSTDGEALVCKDDVVLADDSNPS